MTPMCKPTRILLNGLLKYHGRERETVRVAVIRIGLSDCNGETI